MERLHAAAAVGVARRRVCLWVWACAFVASCGAGGTSASETPDPGGPQSALARTVNGTSSPAVEGVLESEQAPEARLALEALSAVVTLGATQGQAPSSGLRVERAQLVMDCCGRLAPIAPEVRQHEAADGRWLIEQMVAPQSGQWRLSLACFDAADRAFVLNFVFRAQ